MTQLHETNSSTGDTSHEIMATDPIIAEIQERFRVSEETADVLSVLDDGGIHAGGGAPDEWRDHAFAGTTAGTDEAWATAREKGGWSSMSLFSEQLRREKSEGGVTAFNSDDEKMQELERAGLTMRQARDFVVYALTADRPVKARDTEILRPMNIHPNNPSVLLGKGTFTPLGEGRPRELEVTTTIDSEGEVIGFSAVSRPWNYDLDGPAR